MTVVPNFLNSQATLIVAEQGCFLFSRHLEGHLDELTRFKLTLLQKHSRWVSQVTFPCYEKLPNSPKSCLSFQPCVWPLSWWWLFLWSSRSPSLDRKKVHKVKRWPLSDRMPLVRKERFLVRTTQTASPAQTRSCWPVKGSQTRSQRKGVCQRNLSNLATLSSVEFGSGPSQDGSARVPFQPSQLRLGVWERIRTSVKVAGSPLMLGKVNHLRSEIVNARKVTWGSWTRRLSRSVWHLRRTLPATRRVHVRTFILSTKVLKPDDLLLSKSNCSLTQTN